jgi:uncharacterized RDD family membrane protein YckC
MQNSPPPAVQRTTQATIQPAVQATLQATHSSALAFHRAPHIRRAAAWVIDNIVVLLLFSTLPQPVYFLLFPALLVTYHTMLIWSMQQTVGKALLGLEVKRISGKPTLLWALGRASLGYFVVDVVGVGTITALFTRSHRCLHDYVFGSVVTFSGAPTKAGNLLARLEQFAERQKAAVQTKTKTATILVAFWASLVSVSKTVKKVVDRLAGVAPSGATPSVAGAISLNLAAAITVAAAAASVAVSTYVPSVRYAAEWWVAPRYFLADPPAGWVQCSCPSQHPFAGALYLRDRKFERWHEGGLTCPE